MDFSTPLPIKASARLIYHLGEQLISDELVALLELIKNSYDADSTSVEVKIENNKETPYGKGLITIQDNGNGMLPSIIVDGFLRLATNYKKENKISPYYNRKTLGEKGLGRLSFQRLGKYIEVITVPRLDRLNVEKELDIEYIEKRRFNKFEIKMDWEGFSEDANFDEITANVNPDKDFESKYGTCIKIYGIRNSNFWELNKEKRERLQGEILSMTNPFVSNKSNDKFNLKIDINGEKFFVDSIEESIVDKLSDVSVSFSMDKGILTIKSDIKEKYFNRTKEEYLKKQKDFNMKVIKDNCIYKNYKTHTITIDFKDEIDVKNKISWIKDDIFNKIEGKYATDFSFSGSFYAVDKQAANRTDISEELLNQSIYIQKNFTKIGKLWDQISGIYIYRDRFRILPYGKADWLGFTTLSQKSKATIYKQGNVAGYIKVDGKKSELLKEQTNRQGILQDEQGYNFLNILSRVIAQQIFDWDTKAFRANFAAPRLDKNQGYYCNADRSLLFQSLPNIEKIYTVEEKEFDKTVKNINVNDNQLSLFDDIKENIVKKAVQFKEISVEYNKELKQRLNLMNEKIEEYKEIIPLLGQSIIMETVTHEFYRIYSKMATTLSKLELLCKESTFDDINLRKELKSLIQEFNREISDLDLQLNHIAPTHRNKLKDEVDINFKDFIYENYVKQGVIAERLSKKGIRCQINGSEFTHRMSLGNAIVVFDNLVLNSEYWLTKFSILNATIYFELSDERNIIIWDNGRGIDPLIENLLFEPFKSQKELGRGLGLYIVQELLALVGANIRLLDERNGWGNKYKFKIEFSGG